MRILIKNGTILTAENEFKGDLLTEGEKIKAIGDLSGMEADQVIDAEGKILRICRNDWKLRLKN